MPNESKNESQLAIEAQKLIDAWNAGASTLGEFELALRDACRTALGESRDGLMKLTGERCLLAEFSPMELALTITALRERFPGSSPTADRLQRILDDHHVAMIVSNDDHHVFDFDSDGLCNFCHESHRTAPKGKCEARIRNRRPVNAPR